MRRNHKHLDPRTSDVKSTDRLFMRVLLLLGIAHAKRESNTKTTEAPIYSMLPDTKF